MHVTYTAQLFVYLQFCDVIVIVLQFLNSISSVVFLVKKDWWRFLYLSLRALEVPVGLRVSEAVDSSASVASSPCCSSQTTSVLERDQ